MEQSEKREQKAREEKRLKFQVSEKHLSRERTLNSRIIAIALPV